MQQPIINFGHANGFPAKSYTKIFDALKDEFQIIAKDKYAHDINYPITANWLKTAEEMIVFIEANSAEPVIGIGHSFGATTTLNAAFKRPELFKAIILIEPVIMNGFRSIFAPLLNNLNLTPYFSPARKSKDRMRSWPDMETAESYFKSKGLFNRLDEDCLQDYLKYGLKQTDKGYELDFTVEQEVAIFSEMPYHFDRFKGRLANLPGKLFSGATTQVSIPSIMKRLAAQHNFDWEIIKGSHMTPLEYPLEMASKIKQYIEQIKLS